MSERLRCSLAHPADSHVTRVADYRVYVERDTIRHGTAVFSLR